MIISHSRKFVFIHVPKTGGTSIEKLLVRHLDLSKDEVVWTLQRKHLTARQCAEELGPEKWNRYFKFAFVRNPWDVCISDYFFCRQLDENDYLLTDALFAQKIKKIKEIGFKDYLLSPTIVRIQRYTHSADGRNMLDFIGRYESLEEDFKAVCRRIGLLPLELPRENSSKHQHYSFYYTPETEQIVRERYKEEIAWLGYKFKPVKKSKSRDAFLTNIFNPQPIAWPVFDPQSKKMIFRSRRPFSVYFQTWIGGMRRAGCFRDVRLYCMFVGYPHSGHSLIGSLLDAHPDCMIAHETDALELFKKGFSKKQIFSALLENSELFAKHGRKWSDYSYQVTGQWQGRSRHLSVIGDKRGAKSSGEIKQHPEILDDFSHMLGLKIRLIHVIRNPYDTIATLCRMKGVQGKPDRNLIDYYFSLCEVNNLIREKMPESILDIKHEDFIQDPKSHLRRLCCFLGLDPEEGYLESCVSIVFPAPHQSRSGLDWDKALIDYVREKLEKFEFLKGYTF